MTVASNEMDMAELLEDNQRLRDELEKLEHYYFQLKKSNLKQPQNFKPRNLEVINRQASLLGDVTHQSKRMRMKSILSHYLRYGGMMVKEYTPNSCLVCFEISVQGESVAEYAIRMSINEDSDQWHLKSYHLPIAFCLDVINSKCEIMTAEYFSLMYKALIAHHERLHQIKKIKNILPNYAQISNRLNGSLVEFELFIGSQSEPNMNIMQVVLTLHYDLLESRPNDIEITKYGISDSIEITHLKQQLQVFRSSTLVEGFEVGLRNKGNKYYCLNDSEMAKYEQSLNHENEYKQNYREKNKKHQVDMDDNDDFMQENIGHIKINKRNNLNSRSNFGEIIPYTSNESSKVSKNGKHNIKSRCADPVDYFLKNDNQMQRSQDGNSDISRYSPDRPSTVHKKTKNAQETVSKKNTDKLSKNNQLKIKKVAETSVKKVGQPTKSKNNTNTKGRSKKC